MARRMLADSAIVAVGMMVGNVLSYGFSFALSHQLGSVGYGQIGTLLSLFLVAAIPATALQAVAARRVAEATAADGGVPGGGSGPWRVRWCAGRCWSACWRRPRCCCSPQRCPPRCLPYPPPRWPGPRSRWGRTR